MESNAFAFLAPEIIDDVIDQIAGRERFFADHLNLSQLAGTWGDFFRGAGSVFYADSGICKVERRVCNNGSLEESYIDAADVEKLPEKIHFHVSCTAQYLCATRKSFDLLSRIAPRFYGRILDVRFMMTPEMQRDEEAMATMQRCLEGFRPRFEGIIICFRESEAEIRNLHVDFVARMLQSRFLRYLEIQDVAPLKWPIDLEALLIPFCTSDQFEFFRSESETKYSMDLVSAVYEALRRKDCPLDLKQRGINVVIEKETARRLAEKYDMKPIKGVVYEDVRLNFNIRYWKQEPNSMTPGMSVELLLAKNVETSTIWGTRDDVFRAIVFLQKCNSKSLDEEYDKSRQPSGKWHASVFMRYRTHGVELPAEIPFKLRSVNDANAKTEGWFTAKGSYKSWG